MHQGLFHIILRLKLISIVYWLQFTVSESSSVFCHLRLLAMTTLKNIYFFIVTWFLVKFPLTQKRLISKSISWFPSTKQTLNRREHPPYPPIHKQNPFAQLSQCQATNIDNRQLYVASPQSSRCEPSLRFSPNLYLRILAVDSGGST